MTPALQAAIANAVIPPQDEVRRLVALAKAGDSQAMDRVCESCYKWIAKEAAKHVTSAAYDAEDLFVAGVEGVMRAVETYDETQADFLTYAATWISSKIGRFIGSNLLTIGVPQAKVFAKNADGENIHRYQMLPLDFDVDGLPLHDAIADEDMADPSAAAALGMNAEQIEAALKSLTPRQAEIVRRRFGFGCEPQTLEQIGQALGVCREAIRLALRRSLRKLRRKIKR